MSRITKELAKYYTVGQLRAAIKIRQGNQNITKLEQRKQQASRLAKSLNKSRKPGDHYEYYVSPGE